MAKVTCAISGIDFTTTGMDFLTIPHTSGFIHPVFTLESKQLHKLYIRHCRGLIQPSDSYLLFMALLHSSNSIQWDYPSSLTPNSLQTSVVIENNICQLVEVLDQSRRILHPHFKQPTFRVTYGNCALSQIPNWIKAWRKNITSFGEAQLDEKEYESLKRLTNKLTYLINDSSVEMYEMANTIAHWANRAAEFPKDKAMLYQTTIANSFNRAKMFNTPIALLKEVKEYCQSNIDVGSIHFHSLTRTLDAGIKNHIDYLGGDSQSVGYTLLPSISAVDREVIQKNESEISVLIATAPESEPLATEYSSNLAFLKAKLAYRVAQNRVKLAKKAALLASQTAPDVATPTGDL